MTSQSWTDLPHDARTAVEAHCGEVVRVDHPTAGRHSDFSASLLTTTDTIFVKGIQVDSPHARMHRNEARVNPFLPPVAPRLLWEVDVSGWLLHGYEHVSGDHANLEPNSPDLAFVAVAVAQIEEALTPCPPVDVASFAFQWQRLSAWQRLRNEPPADLDSWTRDHLTLGAESESEALEQVDGDSLAHTDLHGLNILVGERARVIDWAWARRAAPWVDTAFMVIRLIDAGHSPQDAERWASVIPAWQDAPDGAVSLFALEVLGVWEYLLHNDPLPHRAQLTDVARRWAQYRHASVGV